jgi:heme-degrading monooxygenase HmoA
MIARTWRGVTPAEKGDDYLAYLHATGLAEIRKTPGNHGVRVLRRTVGKGLAAREEFVLTSLWDSWEAVRAFAGDDPERAVYYPEDASYLLEMTPGVEHYEVAADL